MTAAPPDSTTFFFDESEPYDHYNCQLKVTDAAGNASAPLRVVTVSIRGQAWLRGSGYGAAIADFTLPAGIDITNIRPDPATQPILDPLGFQYEYHYCDPGWSPYERCEVGMYSSAVVSPIQTVEGTIPLLVDIPSYGIRGMRFTFDYTLTAHSGSISDLTGQHTANSLLPLDLSIAGTPPETALQRFSCDQSTWSDLEPFTVNKVFDCASGLYGCDGSDGPRTVYVQLFNDFQAENYYDPYDNQLIRDNYTAFPPEGRNGDFQPIFSTGEFTLDTIAPVFLGISATSNNAIPGFATTGDTLTFNLTLGAADTGSGGMLTYSIGAATGFTANISVSDTVTTGYTATHEVLTGQNGTISITDIAFSDRAGNSLTGFTSPTTPVPNVTVDAEPVVVAINRADASPTTAASVDFMVTFSEPVFDIETADFALAATRTANGLMSSVSAASGTIVTVTVDGIAGDGTLGLNFDFDALDSVQDGEGNLVEEDFTGETYVIDNTAPVLTSFSRQTPVDQSTNADTLVFRAGFDGEVQNVNVADFTVNGATTATATGIATVTENTVFDVTLSGGDLAEFNGVVGLDLAAGLDIADLVGNALPAEEPAIDETYLVYNGSDYGDAPDPLAGTAGEYPTLLASNGARHAVGGGLFLGACVDVDVDGQPSGTASGDDQVAGTPMIGACIDNDDEDGVVFKRKSYPSGTVELDLTVSLAGWVDAWIDFNQDGDWHDAEEQIFASQSVLAGVNTLGFTVPDTAVIGMTFARFRVSTAGGLAPDGAALDGEVEDYQVEIVEPLIFADNFESGDISEWSASVRETEYLEGVPSLGDELLVELEVDLRRSGRSEVVGITGEGQAAFRLDLEYHPGELQVTMSARLDNGTWVATTVVLVASRGALLDLEWRRAWGPRANNGEMYLSVDGVTVAWLTGLDTDKYSVREVVAIGDLEVNLRD